VLISDGLDTRSRTSADSVIEAALEQHVSFYVIHFPLFEPRDGRLEVRRPSKGFKELAEKTGGKYFLVGDAKSALAPKPTDLTPSSRHRRGFEKPVPFGFLYSRIIARQPQTRFLCEYETEGVEYSWDAMVIRARKSS
jgi:hypothetical protein